MRASKVLNIWLKMSNIFSLSFVLHTDNVSEENTLAGFAHVIFVIVYVPMLFFYFNYMHNNIKKIGNSTCIFNNKIFSFNH